jgi:hypothetical protein
MSSLVLRVRNFFVSLRLTVVLLALGMVLILWATLRQVDLGVWGVQEQFFHRFLVIQKIPGTPLWAPFPGGYFIGGLLLINLIAAHLQRFKFTRDKLGIQFTHAGLILLLVGELLSGVWQEEYAMRITEGETKNYAESYRKNELAIIDETDPKMDDVVAIPEEVIASATAPIQHPKLPFRVVVRQYFPNSRPAEPDEKNVPPPLAPATQGIGRNVGVIPEALTYKQDERNLPAAFVELTGSDGVIGTWLVAPWRNFPPQHFQYAGRSWRIAFRFTREYYPFTFKLLDFAHDVYVGTDIPKNYSSKIQVSDGTAGETREVLIYMNNPLRYAGRTFYQASYESEVTTILQVVRNPSWRLPYIACTMMALGLVLQFGAHLLKFISRRRAVVA